MDKFIEKNKKILGAVMGTAVLIVALASGSYLVQQRQLIESSAARLSLPSLYMSTFTSKPKVGDIIDVAVSVDSKSMTITGADLRVHYDTSKLEAITFTGFGDFLPSTLIAGAITKTDTPI